jgi:hypothetical protein
MIVLDEQLLGRDLETTITVWYTGAVVYITDLRPQPRYQRRLNPAPALATKPAYVCDD